MFTILRQALVENCLALVRGSQLHRVELHLRVPALRARLFNLFVSRDCAELGTERGYQQQQKQQHQQQ